MKLLILAITLFASVFADKLKPDCNEKCPRIYLPVCGSDGKKYNNKCLMKFAACEQGKVIHPIVGCSKIVKPVCGSDGKKYNSKCLLIVAACATGKEIDVVKCEDIDLAQAEDDIENGILHAEGTQLRREESNPQENIQTITDNPKPDCDQKCPKTHWPVCGSDGKNYSNECLMKSAACEQGKSINPIVGCPRIVRPVCGSNGKIYNNKCLLTVAACESGKEINVVKCKHADLARGDEETESENLKTKGTQIGSGKSNSQENNQTLTDIPKKNCDKRCPNVKSPVCGSDGKKYNNKCLIKLASCEEGKTIYPVSKCPKIKKPVCGSDGKRYNNPCELALANCKTGKNIKPIAGCSKVIQPVCGSNGKKYNSLCEMKIAACKTGKDLYPIVGCPKIFQPVCGSNGKKYNSPCELKVNACKTGEDIHSFVGCRKIIKRVCGSDGKIYNNPCELTLAACKTGKHIYPLPNGCSETKKPVEVAEKNATTNAS